MNTNLKNKKDTQKAFADLFAFKDEKEEIKHKAHMLMFRFLSEIAKVAEERRLKKKDLAKIIGTSPSYVTQLFRGDKLINLETLAKLEQGLNIDFDIKIKAEESGISINNDFASVVLHTKKDRKRQQLSSIIFSSVVKGTEQSPLSEGIFSYEQQAA